MIFSQRETSTTSQTFNYRLRNVGLFQSASSSLRMLLESKEIGVMSLEQPPTCLMNSWIRENFEEHNTVGYVHKGKSGRPHTAKMCCFLGYGVGKVHMFTTQSLPHKVDVTKELHVQAFGAFLKEPSKSLLLNVILRS